MPLENKLTGELRRGNSRFTINLHPSNRTSTHTNDEFRGCSFNARPGRARRRLKAEESETIHEAFFESIQMTTKKKIERFLNLLSQTEKAMDRAFEFGIGERPDFELFFERLREFGEENLRKLSIPKTDRNGAFNYDFGKN